MSPVGVNTLYLVTPLLLSASGAGALKVSRYLGRAQTNVLYAYVGISLLLTMSVMDQWWEDWRVMCPIYVIRTVVMNSCAPLRKVRWSPVQRLILCVCHRVYRSPAVSV